MKTSEIIFELTHGHDGPVTEFVVMSRALRLAAEGEADPRDIENIVFEILDLDFVDDIHDKVKEV